jgi:hypothetical protein
MAKKQIADLSRQESKNIDV